MNKSLLYSILLVAAGAALYLVGSAGTGFQGTDELRYGQIAKELGPAIPDYFLLHFNGARYTDKPPLYFWTVRMGYALTGGVSPLGLRLPGVASALACLLLTFFLMRTLTGREGLSLAVALTLMISPRFLWITRWGRLDIMMCAFIYAGMLQFIRAWMHDRSRVGSAWFWTLLGFSFAVKGPAGPVVMLGATMSFMIWETLASDAPESGVGRFSAARRAVRPLFRWPGLVAAILVNLAWYGPIFVLDRTSGSTDMVVDELVSRTFTPDRHVEPPYYYFKNIWYDAFPAMPFVLFAVILLIAERRRGHKEAPGSSAPAGFFAGSSTALRFLLCWFVFTLAFFSVYPPKRAQYLLPMYPAVAGLGVMLIDHCARRMMAGWGRGSLIFRIPAGVILFAIGAVAPLLIWRFELGGLASDMLKEGNPELALQIHDGIEAFEYGVHRLSRAGQVAGTLIVAGVVLAGFVALIMGRFRAVYGTILAAGYGGMFFFFGWMIPPVFPDEDLRRFARETEARLKERPGLKIAMYGEDKPFFNIYGDFHIQYFEDKEVLKEFSAYIREHTPMMVILESKEARKHGDDPPLNTMTRRETVMRGEPVFVYETPE